MLEIKGLTLTYKNTGKRALNNVSLTVEDGEIYGFLGANGAGKSTAIKCIVGILQQDSGEIFFDGKNIRSDLRAFKANIGYEPDLSNAYERISGGHYLHRVASVYGMTDAVAREKRIREVSEKFAFEKYLSQPVKTYSHGTKQKLNFIAGILHRPRLLILDEPMTGLDPESTLTLIEIIQEYAKEGNSVFFSSHLLNVVENVCDTVGILKTGEMKGEYKVKSLPGSIKALYKEFNQ